MNGTACGPSWLPTPARKWLFGWFFEASCVKHDDGYRQGGSELRRWECDYKFFRAMVKDSTTPVDKLTPLKLGVAVGFYAAVALGGWTRFNYKTKA